jgi:flagellar biosynthesis protein FlhB
MAESAQEKTEAPTPRRRWEARQEGRIARSVELSTAIVLLAGTIGLSVGCGRALTEYATKLLRESSRALSAGNLTMSGGILVLRSTAAGFLFAVLPLGLVLMGGAIAINAAQARGLFTTKPIEPKWSNIDPISGFRRLANLEAWFTLAKSIVKLAAIGLITWLVIRRSWPELVSLSSAGPAEIAIVLKTVLTRLAAIAGLAFLLIASIDYAYQRFQLERSLRMTRQEVILEHRETEGDPRTKSRIRSMALAMARKRMLQRVPTADVVITNPTHIAVALRYDTSIAPAPIVVAMGQRKLAERIKAIARKADVPIIENKPIARALLATAKVGYPIPPALYAAVAEILAFIYRKRGRLRGILDEARRQGRIA